MSKGWTSVVSLACILCCAALASATVVYRDVGELTVQSREIVIGDVVDVTSFWNDDHTLIKSRITIAVDQYVLGGGSGVEVLEMSGGTVDDLTLHVSVLPVFESGDHVLLFLGDSEIRLVESYQGAYLTDGEQVARMMAGCGRIIADSLQPLGDLLAEIQQALPPGSPLPALERYTGEFELPVNGLRYSLCGYDWTYKSNPMGETYRINPNCVDSSAGDDASQIEQIQNGFGVWNNGGAQFAFTYGGTSTQTSVSYNSTNLLYFDTTPPDGGGYVAANYHWVSGGNMLESDIVFNDEYTWWNGDGTCSGKMDIWNIATHELGHTMCLLDLYGGADSEKTMYGYVSYCETKKRTLHSDDINGFVSIYGAGSADNEPPEPNPMTFELAPESISTTAVTMIATDATDATPPVEYYFYCTAGHSNWKEDRNHTFSNLQPNALYDFYVKAHDDVVPSNEGDWSAAHPACTFIQTPTGINFSTVTTSSIAMSASGTLSRLTTGSSGVYFDSTTSGGDGGLHEWLQVIGDTATGLSPNSSYTFQAKARNQLELETSYGPTGTKVTLANDAAAPTLSNPTSTAMDINVNVNGNPSYTEFAIYCLDTTDGNWVSRWVGTDGLPAFMAEWQTDAGWGTITAQNMQPGTTYTFAVLARNAEDVESDMGPGASLDTEPTTGGACCFPDGSCTEGTESDCGNAGGLYQGDGTDCDPNPCPIDCNGNGVDDADDIANGTSADSNTNGVPDECDIDAGTSEDCNTNGVPDEVETDTTSGLAGAYYDDLGFAGTMRGRIDPTIDFQWGTAAAWPGFGDSTFTIRWTGYVLTPDVGGDYVFYTTTDDGVRLWVAGQLLIDEWVDQSATEWSGSIALHANAVYALVLEYYENSGDAAAELRWEPPGQSKVLIPGASLIPGRDCNSNGVPDACDIASSFSDDDNGNGIPDECEWPVGDMNCDGEVDFGDINPFVQALSDPAAYEAAYPDCDINNGDCNEDGPVDFGDINAFVALLTG